MRRQLHWFLLVLTLIAVFVDLGPTMPVKFSLGNFKIDYTFTRPELDFAFLGFRWRRDLEFKKGLDLAGGTHLVFSADVKNIPNDSRNQALESLRGVIERRVNLYGVAEAVVQTAKTSEDYRVIVEIPGVTDTAAALELIGKTAELTFREISTATEEGKIATESALVYGPFQKETDLSGRDLKRASPVFDPQTSEPVVQLNFNDEGAIKFERITKENLGKQLAIFLDNQLLMAPTVQAVISGGQAVITGSFTAAQTKQMAILLNSGALPAPVKVIEQRTIGATLGQQSVDKSLLAGLVGLTVTVLFMIGNYGRLGIIASLALGVYILVSLALFKLIPITLTLAGIAGFILSVGMAVDANILIFERIKEEIRWGKNRLVAIDVGFARAFPSIRDSNTSSLITCAILYWFGTGPVRGFALTLALGILLSLFSSITVTKTLLRLTKN